MAMTEYPAGTLDNIGFVVIFTRYQGKWVYCWYRHRKSFEHPAGHVEPDEILVEAAKRELFEETGIKECKLIPLWDYEYIWENGQGRNNGRVFYAEVNSLGSLPESEMERIEFFDTVPENYTYNREDEIRDIAKVEEMLKEYI